MGEGRRGPYLWGLIALHDQYPSQVEAALIAVGLRWRDAGAAHCQWDDVHAIVQTQAWDSPLARAVEPKFWHWGHPWAEWLAVLTESAHNGALMQGNWSKAKSSQFLKIKRPNQTVKTETKFGNNPIPLAELDAWLDARIT